MNPETSENPRGGTSRERKTPLDVRIVAYYLYANSLLFLSLSFFIATGVASPQPHRALLGSVMVTSRLADSIDKLTAGTLFLFCAWGLMRRVGFTWWFSLIVFIYGSTNALLVLPEQQIHVAISIAIDIVLIVWLYLRRDLYGICVKKNS